jgi:SNF2 family DNA or RNA helicase
MRLRRACCHPRLVEPAVDIPGTKIQVLKDLLQELIENRHKTLIFSQFTDFLKIVEAEIREMGIPYQYLDGQTPVRQRRQRIEAFQNGEGEVFLISLRAGGLGLNLTAANYVIHLDPWWNPAVEDQASDRAHRIGQTRPVTIYRFITRNTIEEKILDLHQQKRDLAHSLLEGTDTAGVVSVDELLALLQHDIPERIKIVN